MAQMNVKNITLEGNDEKKKKFCEIWPMVKSGLEMLADLVKNPIAKGSIKLVITAGDTIVGSICK